jgi:hypothetical protein
MTQPPWDQPTQPTEPPTQPVQPVRPMPEAPPTTGVGGSTAFPEAPAREPRERRARSGKHWTASINRYLPLALAVLLALILLTEIIDVVQDRQEVEDQHEVQCTYLQFGGATGEDKKDAPELAYSDLGPADRKVADLLDCDIDGR